MELPRWGLTQDLVAEVLPRVPAESGVYEAGGFLIIVPSPVERSISLTYWRRSPDGIVYSGLQFWRQYEPRSASNLQELFVHSKGRILSYENYQLQDIPNYSADGDTYPSFKYKWYGERAGTDLAGQLSFLRVDLAGDTFVCYEPSGDRDVHGNVGILRQAPKSIANLTEILGQSIPWKIDHNRWVEEKLKRMGLADLSKTLRTESPQRAGEAVLERWNILGSIKH